MNHKLIYDSRDIRCKKPYGAVPSGTAVQFTLRPPHEAGFTRAQLTASFEAWDETIVIREMPLVASEQGVDQFSTELNTGDYIGLVWYSFKLLDVQGKKPNLAPISLPYTTARSRYPPGLAKV